MDIASALSNNAATFVTSSFLTMSPKKAPHVDQWAISKIPKTIAPGISKYKLRLSEYASHPIKHITIAMVISIVIITFLRENLSAKTPPIGPVTVPIIATVNKIVERADALPVVS